MNKPNQRTDSNRSSSKSSRPFTKRRDTNNSTSRNESGDRSASTGSFSNSKPSYGGDRGYQSRGNTSDRSSTRGSSSYSRGGSSDRGSYGNKSEGQSGGYKTRSGSSYGDRGSSSTGSSYGNRGSSSSYGRRTSGSSYASSDRGSSSTGYKPRTGSSYNDRGSSSTGSSYGNRGSSSTGSSYSSSSRGGYSSGGGQRSFSNRRSNSGSAPRRSSFKGGRTSFNPMQFINTNPVEAEVEVYTPTHLFSTFGLNETLAKAIADMGLTEPTPIQDQIIPEILKGNDVVGLAETGTGKTAAFLVPLIEKAMKAPERQALILAPTRELATQIEAEFQKFAKGLKISATVCVGGVRIFPQIKALQRKNNFIIGTPGRILDLIKNKHLDTSGMTTIVLDEADRMLDMGFINDIKTILSKLPAKRETLFFSATMSNETHVLVKTFMQNPVNISVKKKDITNSIEQNVVQFEDEGKFETLTNLLDQDMFSRVIIFCDMKHSTEQLSRNLVRCGIKSVSIHGNKNQGQRQRALDAFKQGSAQVLVATDVAARGIHVDNVSHVINYDLPKTFHDYVHRIGRTGRGTKHGKALTFVSSKPARTEGRGERSPARRQSGRPSFSRGR